MASRSAFVSRLRPLPTHTPSSPQKQELPARSLRIPRLGRLEGVLGGYGSFPLHWRWRSILRSIRTISDHKHHRRCSAATIPYGPGAPPCGRGGGQDAADLARASSYSPKCLEEVFSEVRMCTEFSEVGSDYVRSSTKAILTAWRSWWLARSRSL